jgi:carbonic anhydrase
VDRIRPSIEDAAARGVTDLDAVATTHIGLTADMLTQSGIADAVAAKECAVVGMAYRLEDGRVTVISSSTDDWSPRP